MYGTCCEDHAEKRKKRKKKKKKKNESTPVKDISVFAILEIPGEQYQMNQEESPSCQENKADCHKKERAFSRLPERTKQPK